MVSKAWPQFVTGTYGCKVNDLKNYFECHDPLLSLWLKSFIDLVTANSFCFTQTAVNFSVFYTIYLCHITPQGLINTVKTKLPWIIKTNIVFSVNKLYVSLTKVEACTNLCQWISWRISRYLRLPSREVKYFEFHSLDYDPFAMVG